METVPSEQEALTQEEIAAALQQVLQQLARLEHSNRQAELAAMETRLVALRCEARRLELECDQRSQVAQHSNLHRQTTDPAASVNLANQPASVDSPAPRRE